MVYLYNKFSTIFYTTLKSSIFSWQWSSLDMNSSETLWKWGYELGILQTVSTIDFFEVGIQQVKNCKGFDFIFRLQL